MRRRRFPLGEAAFATRRVSSRIAKSSWGWSDTGGTRGQGLSGGSPGPFSVDISRSNHSGHGYGGDERGASLETKGANQGLLDDAAEENLQQSACISSLISGSSASRPILRTRAPWRFPAERTS